MESIRACFRGSHVPESRTESTPVFQAHCCGRHDDCGLPGWLPHQWPCRTQGAWKKHPVDGVPRRLRDPVIPSWCSSHQWVHWHTRWLLGGISSFIRIDKLCLATWGLPPTLARQWFRIGKKVAKGLSYNFTWYPWDLIDIGPDSTTKPVKQGLSTLSLQMQSLSILTSSGHGTHCLGCSWEWLRFDGCA